MMAFIKKGLAVVVLLILSLFLNSAWATPFSKISKRATPIGGGVDLRISPLGDSITYGSDSSDGNGYRQHLQSLILPTNKLLYIGSVNSGTMTNSENEGHPGYTIDEIGGQAKNSLPERPNVVLLMAGTNDIVQVLDLSTAPTRLGNLIDLVFSDCPDAVVIVATLTGLLDPTREANREAYNKAIPGVVAQRANAGKHVLIADMNVVPQSDLDTVDGIHPNDVGYAIMANVWYAALVQAGNNGWITPPVAGAPIPPTKPPNPSKGSTSGNGVCSTFPNWNAAVEIAYGVGSGDGPFQQNWVLQKAIALGVPQSASDIFLAAGGFTPNYVDMGEIALGIPNPGGIIFADIDGDGRDDYLSLSESGAVTAWLNTGSFPGWKSLGEIAFGVGADRSQVRFADVDCDGYADYLVVHDNGTVSAYLNLGPSRFPAWNDHGIIYSYPGVNSATMHFADLNGDGCVDYLYVNPANGAVIASLNDHKFGSTSLGTIAEGVGTPGSAIAFADINGDGLADYLSIGSGGSVNAWLNMGTSSFPAWNAIGLLATGEQGAGQNLTFAKLNPTAVQDLRADYLTIDDSTGAIHAWKNQGYGDTIGAGLRFADLDGDGKDDYIFLTQDGHARAFLNTGSFPTWKDLGIIAHGFGTRDVIFADVNCDGRADYLLVDRNNGAVTAYLNLGVSSFPAWGPPTEIAYGVGVAGSWVTFADINGDGCVDYLTINPANGAVSAWLNTGHFPNWDEIGLIATGVGSPGTDIRFADINGDGRSDYIILHDDGSATVYTNLPGTGVIPLWGPEPVTLANGVGATRDNVLFADVDGDGKADYLVINPQSGAVDAYLNKGSGGTAQAGDGVRFADLNGDGKADYLWLDTDGSVHMYANGGPSAWPAWTSVGTSGHGDGATRQNVLFADVNCDGYEDYLVISDVGGVTAYYNTKNFPSWGSPTSIAFGVGATREAIRFADVDGDGCADYLVMDPDGRTTAYLNLGPSHFPAWGPATVIAEGVGAARESVQWADINGDGFADYLVVDPVDGAVQAWTSKGGPLANPPWSYYQSGYIAYGVGVGGSRVQFADVNGDKLADYLKIDAATAAVTAWQNPCAAPGDPSPTASPTLTALPDSSPTAWMTVDCLNPGVTNAATNQTTRWNDLDADDAFDAAVASWNAGPSHGQLNFSEQVSNFFNGPEQMQCGTTADHNGCETFILCSSTNKPAGYFILNSFVAINNMNLNFYDALSRVEAQITAEMSTFQATFAPIDDQTMALKLILDLVGLGFALAAAPVWDAAFKALPYFERNPNQLELIKDEVNGMVAGGLVIAGDATSSGSTAIDAQNTLEVNVAAMVTIWYDTITFLNTQMFNGSSTSISQIRNMITEGKMLLPGHSVDDVTIQSDFEHAVYGLLIPQAWSLSNRQVYPFILDSGFPCSAVNPLPTYMSDDTGDQTYMCHNNKLYYLLSTTGPARSCDFVPCGITNCTPNLFTAPPGLSALVGGAYGGVNYTEFIIGALNSYAANNNQNGWPSADPGNSDTISALYHTGIETPGVVQIPVCTAEVAYANWLLLEIGTPPANYPCQPLTSSTKRSVEKMLEEEEAFQRSENYKRC